MTKVVVQKDKKLDDGMHKGVIKDVQFREKPYKYTDLIIELADGFTVKAGYPTIATKSSKLGLMLQRFGAKLDEGQEVDIEATVVGKECQFQSITEHKGEKKYAKVITESVKPRVKEEAVS